jgi:hypothetical protein
MVDTVDTKGRRWLRKKMSVKRSLVCTFEHKRTRLQISDLGFGAIPEPMTTHSNPIQPRSNERFITGDRIHTPPPPTQL